MDALATTFDGMLDRRVTLEQPAQGYRVAVDTVLLAAAVPALAGDAVLDLGCGVGGAMLALACRVAGITGYGVDIQEELIEICRRNIERNFFASGFQARVSDAVRTPRDFVAAFDHVLINPPYHEAARHDASPDAIRQTANTEKTGDLGLWISSAALALRPSGTLTLIHRADRQQEILQHLLAEFGGVDILPLPPKEGAKAKRLIVRARKAEVYSVRTCRPLILHKSDGGYTDAAQAVLRQAQALVLQSP